MREIIGGHPRRPARIRVHKSGIIEIIDPNHCATYFDGDMVSWLAATLTEIAGGQPEPEPAKTQVGGDHYAKHAIQPWDAIREWYGDEGFEAYLAGNVIRYLARYKDKNGVEDIRKAAHYCERLIQHLEGRGR